MGMSTHVTGFRPADEKWKRMKDIYDLCEQQKIEIPAEVVKFFGYDRPDSSGVEVKLNDALSEFEDDYRSGYEVRVDKLPKDISVIRFWNSW